MEVAAYSGNHMHSYEKQREQAFRRLLLFLYQTFTLCPYSVNSESLYFAQRQTKGSIMRKTLILSVIFVVAMGVTLSAQPMNEQQV
jgi:hypothetical protein